MITFGIFEGVTAIVDLALEIAKCVLSIAVTSSQLIICLIKQDVKVGSYDSMGVTTESLKDLVFYDLLHAHGLL